MKPHNLMLGTTVMASASAVRVAIQIIILPVIGRLLGPKAYGQIALVSPFIYFSMLLAESGLGAVIVRADRLSKELEGTIFCFSTVLSVVFIAIFAALAYPLGRLMGEPMFPPLLIGMSGTLLLASLNIVPAGLILRKKKYKLMAAVDLVSTLCGIAGVVTGIMLGWGVWSIVAQQFCFWASKLAVTAVGARYRPHFVFRRRIIRENIYFGSNITGASIIGFVARNIDNILIGSLMGVKTLGFYALAYQVILLPQMVFSGSAYVSLFSSISEAAREGKVSPKQFLGMLRGVMLVSAPAMVGIAATASMAIPLLLGEQWMPTARLIILLTPFGLCGSIGAASGGVMLGLGRSDVIFRMTLMLSGLTIAVIAIGAFISSDAVAIGLSIVAIFNTIVYMRVLARHCGTSMRAIGKAIAAPLISALIMGCVVLTVRQVVPGGWPLALKLGISMAVGILAYTGILFGLFHDHIREDIATIKAAILARRQ